MDISPDQLEEIRRRLGLTPDEFKRHSKHLTFILEMLEPEQVEALRDWFQKRNRAIADIKQQPFFRR